MRLYQRALERVFKALYIVGGIVIRPSTSIALEKSPVLTAETGADVEPAGSMRMSSPPAFSDGTEWKEFAAAEDIPEVDGFATTEEVEAAVAGREFTRNVRILGAEGATVTERWRAPRNVTVTAILLFAETAPTTAGTYTVAVAGGGNNLLAAATFDLTTVGDGVWNSRPLTATAAHLDLDAGVEIVATFASDNADLAGAGLMLQVVYSPR